MQENHIVKLSKDRHFQENPFAPTMESEKDKFVYENTREQFDSFIDQGIFSIKLPSGFTYTDLSLTTDADKIIAFTNNYYKNDEDTSLTLSLTKKLLDQYNKAGNMYTYGVMYKNTLIAMQMLEFNNYTYKGKTFRGAYIVYSAVHTKFRKKNLFRIMGYYAFNYMAKHGGDVLFAGSSLPLQEFPFAKRHMYRMSLSKIGSVFNRKTPVILRVPINNVIVRKPTVDEMKLLNRPRHTLQIEYAD